MFSSKSLRTILAVIYLLSVTSAEYNGALLPNRTFLPADLLLLTPPWSHHAQELYPGFTHVERPAWDPLFQFYPARKHLAKSLAAGRLPLWNAHSFSGTPFAADDQSASFYPPNWLYAVLPLSAAFGWVAALHTFLAGLFFCLYGRRMGWRWAAALTGATAWMLSGVMVAWQMWQVVDDTLCWLCLALYFVEGKHRGGGTRDCVGAAVALGMAALAGHLQFACYVWITAFAYMIFRDFCKGDPRSRIRSFVRSAGILILGVALASIQILPTLDFLQRTERTVSSYKELMGLTMPAGQLIMTLVPELFGGQRDWMNHSYIGAYNYYELTCFVGAAAVIPAVLAIVLTATGERRRLTIFWVAVACFALLMGCGSPLYAVFYYGVPLFKSFHGPARILVLLDLAIAVLCAQGIQAATECDPPLRKKLTLPATAAVIVVIAIGYRFAVTANGLSIGQILTHSWLGYGLAQIGIAAGASALAGLVLALASIAGMRLIVVVVAADSLLFAVGLNTSAPAMLLYPSTSETSFVSANLDDGRVWCLGDGDPNRYQTRLVPNSAVSLGWRDVAGSDPLVLKWYQPVAEALDQAQFAVPRNEQGSIASVRPIVDRLNVKYIVSPRPVSDPRLDLVNEGDVFVYENENRFGTVRPDPAGSIVNLRLLSDNSCVIAADCHEGTTLQTSLIFDPGWTAKVDGRAMPITPDAIPMRPNLAPVFISVKVGPGSHLVKLEYCPVSVRLGMFLTIIGCLGSGFLLVAGSAIRKPCSKLI